MNNPKLTFQIGKPQIVSFSSKEPSAIGSGDFGPWSVFDVVADGSEYSFFPSKGLLPILMPFLEKGILTVAIEKSAEQGARGILTRWAVSDPKDAGTPQPSTPVTKFEAELNQSSARMVQNNNDESIARAVALKASCEMYAGHDHFKVEDVLLTAQDFLTWLEGKVPPNR